MSYARQHFEPHGYLAWPHWIMETRWWHDRNVRHRSLLFQLYSEVQYQRHEYPQFGLQVERGEWIGYTASLGGRAGDIPRITAQKVIDSFVQAKIVSRRKVRLPGTRQDLTGIRWRDFDAYAAPRSWTVGAEGKGFASRYHRGGGYTAIGRWFLSSPFWQASDPGDRMTILEIMTRLSPVEQVLPSGLRLLPGEWPFTLQGLSKALGPGAKTATVQSVVTRLQEARIIDLRPASDDEFVVSWRDYVMYANHDEAKDLLRLQNEHPNEHGSEHPSEHRNEHGSEHDLTLVFTPVENPREYPLDNPSLVGAPATPPPDQTAGVTAARASSPVEESHGEPPAPPAEPSSLGEPPIACGAAPGEEADQGEAVSPASRQGVAAHPDRTGDGEPQADPFCPEEPSEESPPREAGLHKHMSDWRFAAIRAEAQRVAREAAAKAPWWPEGGRPREVVRNPSLRQLAALAVAVVADVQTLQLWQPIPPLPDFGEACGLIKRLITQLTPDEVAAVIGGVRVHWEAVSLHLDSLGEPDHPHLRLIARKDVRDVVTCVSADLEGWKHAQSIAVSIREVASELGYSVTPTTTLAAYRQLVKLRDSGIAGAEVVELFREIECDPQLFVEQVRDLTLPWDATILTAGRIPIIRDRVKRMQEAQYVAAVSPD